MEALVRANPNLRTVDFAENKTFHDDAVEAVLVNCKYVSQRNYLYSLLTDCRLLYALSLNDCRLLSDGAFSVLSDTKPCASLFSSFPFSQPATARDGPKRKSEEELQIGRTIQNLGLRNLGLTDAALGLITGRCVVLSAIDLHGSLHITDQVRHPAFLVGDQTESISLGCNPSRHCAR